MHDQSKIVKSESRRPLRRIAFFAPTSSEYVDRMFQGVLRYQTDRGGVTVRDYRYDAKEPEDQENWAKRLRPWDSWAEGLVVNISNDPGLREWVTAGGEPAVNTGGLTTMRSVSINADATASRAIEYFRGRGFANFAFASPLGETALWKAFDSQLRAMGIVPIFERIHINPSRWDFASEEQVSADASLLDMLRGAVKPVAMLCENDDVGKAVCLAAQRMGFDVPREVAVLGLCNLASGRACVPPLSSVHFPADEVGYRAVEAVVKLLDGQDVPIRMTVLPGKVVERQSTAMGRSNEIDMLHVIAVIRDRACEGVGIDEIVRELQVSQSTLRREFARMLGRTPGEEMARVRLDRAKELLQTSDLPIAHIAAATGYASQTNFTTFFKGQTGMTPREYRRRRTGVLANESAFSAQ